MNNNKPALNNKPVMKKLLFSLALAVPTFAHAQTYSIDWFTIDGGGGTSTGGVYSVSGTIGQPDAGLAMTGGNYSLVGGFWSIVAAIQTPGAPLLTITRNPANGAVTVSWPLPADGWVLDQTGAVTSPPLAISWSQVAFPYQTNASTISITTASPSENRFYRLRK